MRIATEALQRIRRLFRIEQLPALDPVLSSRERVFHAPPLTPELVAAIKLISPHCNLALDEKSRSFWEAEQNGHAGANMKPWQPNYPLLDVVPKS